MITYEIYYNKTYKNSCNLIKEVKKGHYLDIDQFNKIALIDNIKIAEPNVKIKSTNIEYKR